jgi:hypothetical protein
MLGEEMEIQQTYLTEFGSTYKHEMSGRKKI